MKRLVAVMNFTNLQGKTYNVKIWGQGDSTEIPYVFQGGDSPLIISWTTAETHSPIKTSEANIRLINIEVFKALSFLSLGNRASILEVLEDGVKIWDGFMVPDLWNEGFFNLPNIASFSFIDGLALLKNEPFVFDDSYFQGRVKDYEVISRCLRSIGLNRNFVDCINIYDQNTFEDKIHEGTFFQKYKDLGAFKGMTCWEVLESILISYTARIEYREGKYWFRKVDNDADILRASEYTPDPLSGVHSLFHTYNIPNIISVTPGSVSENRLAWQDESQRLELIPGWKFFNLIQDYGRKQSMIPHSLFNEKDWETDTKIKKWTCHAVRKIVVDKEVCVEFREWNPRRLGGTYVKPAFIETTLLDEYDSRGISEETIDYFRLELRCINRNYIPYISYDYHGPRKNLGGEIGERREPFDYSQFLTPIETVGMRLEMASGSLFFRLAHSDLDDSVIYPFFIIFRDSGNVAKGFRLGIPYLVQPIQPLHHLYLHFRLSDVNSSFFFIHPDEMDEGKDFTVSIYYSYIPVTLRWGADNLGNLGNFLSNQILQFEVDGRDLAEKQFFSLFVDSTSQLFPGIFPFYLRIEKLRDNAIYTRGQDGAWAIESVFLTIIDTPENSEEKIDVNPQNNIEGKVEIKFAETPIKNNFINNNLKFYNNFYSLSLTNAPGKQWWRYEEAVTEKHGVLYGYLYNFWALERIVNISSPGNWQLPTVAAFHELRDRANKDMSGSWETVGTKIKGIRTIQDGHPYWEIHPGGVLGIDVFGFSAYPAGIRNEEGSYMYFGERAVMYPGMEVSYDKESMSITELRRSVGRSVRLVRNTTIFEWTLLPDGYIFPESYVGNNGAVYDSVKIGRFVWLTVNLAETKYSDGTDIVKAESNEQWNSNDEVGKFCSPNGEDRMAVSIFRETQRFPILSTLRELIIDSYSRLYRLPRKLLSGILNSQGENPMNYILQEKHTKKRYLMTGVNWDVFRGEYTGIWHEIGEAKFLPPQEPPVSPQEPPVRLGDFNLDFNLDFYRI